MSTDFWFCNNDSTVKNLKAKKVFFFSMTSKTIIFVLVQVQKVIFCKKRCLFFCLFIGYLNLKDCLLNAHKWQFRQWSRYWESCNVFKQCSLVPPVLAGTAVNGLKQISTSGGRYWDKRGSQWVWGGSTIKSIIFRWYLAKISFNPKMTQLSYSP